jgi:hypothetical protein
MDNYICINGKKAELTKEQMRALGIELPKAKSPFERAEKDECYYTIRSWGDVDWYYESGADFDGNCFNVANYCTDKVIMEQRALHETLNRLLWRYSMEHDGDKIDWNSFYQQKWFIFADVSDGRMHVDNIRICVRPGNIYFHTRETAKNAIKEIIDPFIKAHPEFKW